MAFPVQPSFDSTFSSVTNVARHSMNREYGIIEHFSMTCLVEQATATFGYLRRKNLQKQKSYGTPHAVGIERNSSSLFDMLF